MRFNDSNPNFNDFKEEYEANIWCGCDHGCNQWLKTKETKIALIFRIIQNNRNTSLDKIVQMSDAKANKIFSYISRKEMRARQRARRNK